MQRGRILVEIVGTGGGAKNRVIQEVGGQGRIEARQLEWAIGRRQGNTRGKGMNELGIAAVVGDEPGQEILVRGAHGLEHPRSDHCGERMSRFQCEAAIGHPEPGFEVERIGGNDGVVEVQGAHGLASGK
jgi:hypothetical protein